MAGKTRDSRRVLPQRERFSRRRRLTSIYTACSFTMNTIYSVVRRLLPHGTSGRCSWEAVPFWPPDLFAFAATLVNLSGCYAHTEYHCGFDECSFDAKYRQNVKELGALLASSDIPPAVQKAWDRLLAARDPIVALPDRKCGWWKDAMFLLAVADEACSGFGFASKRSSRLALLVFEAYRDWKAEKPRLLPYVPHSLCLEVPPDETCVQPKTRTPQIGCTLRSLSHNLALLPPVGEVRTYWDYAISHEDNSDEPL